MKKHAGMMAASFAIALSLFAIWPLVRGKVFPENPNDWFVVKQIYVPDHKQGANPLVVYDRVVKQRFKAAWVVEVQTLGPNRKATNVCSGSGRSDYSPSETLPEIGVRWDWYIGKACNVPPGRYRLFTTWDIETPSGIVTLDVLSNVFEVTG